MKTFFSINEFKKLYIVLYWNRANIMYYKYPRTFHVPWSLGATRDDRVLSTMEPFHGKHVIVTEKMDGENCSIYNDHVHARSLSSGAHPSRNWVKALQARISADIPKNWRICGENLFAKHSIFYENLNSYFLVFNIWNEKNYCLDWESTLEWCELLELTTVPVLYDGVYNENQIKKIWNEMDKDKNEGYVIRIANSFHYDEFFNSVAKFVRKEHVTTNQHWMHEKMVANGLKS